MFPITNLDTVLTKDPTNLVVIEQSPEYPGNLLFQTMDDIKFLSIWREWISRYMCINELFMLAPLVQELQASGYEVAFLPNTKPILDGFSRWEQPLEIKDFTCPGGGQLYPFQTFTLNRALEKAQSPSPVDRLFFAGWCAGAGKSLFACAGAQELFNRDMIDVVLCFTLMPMKRNFSYAAKASFDKTTQLDWVNIDANKPTRRRQYQESHQVYVLNTEKMWADYEELRTLTEGRRVLFIFDEAQKVVSGDPNPYHRTKTRRHLDELVQGCQATVWPMSASVVGANPLRYRDVFNLAGSKLRNPLGTATDFEKRYASSVKLWRPSPYAEPVKLYTWNIPKLHEVRHRVIDRTQSARKTDPGVREHFKGNTPELVPIQMSKETRKLYERIKDAARNEEASIVSCYRLLRYLCNTPLALSATQDPLGQLVAAEYPKLITNAHNAKLDYFLDQVEGFADASEKCIAFIKWTNLGLHLIAPEIARKGLNHVLHWGVGQSETEKLRAQTRFKEDPDVTLFFSSDAGAEGISLPEARYNISYDIPYAYDKLMQRSERNNRADSQFDTTTYIYITEDSVEERIWEINEERRKLAAATLGTTETLNYGGRAAKSEEQNARWLIFGEE